MSLTSSSLNLDPPNYRQDAYGYAIWLIDHQWPAIVAFFAACNAYRKRRPTSRFGARMILEHLRYHTAVTTGDEYKINNNAQGLLTRLYLHVHPNAGITSRVSTLDWNPLQWSAVTLAFDSRLRESPRHEYQAIHNE